MLDNEKHKMFMDMKILYIPSQYAPIMAGHRPGIMFCDIFNRSPSLRLVFPPFFQGTNGNGGAERDGRGGNAEPASSDGVQGQQMRGSHTCRIRHHRLQIAGCLGGLL